MKPSLFFIFSSLICASLHYFTVSFFFCLRSFLIRKGEKKLGKYCSAHEETECSVSVAVVYGFLLPFSFLVFF
ncbi:hypothetical protein STCU_11797 [Strigomonas culicis]|uniref:Uncharacterized protein n=1 Tax=Strigomonas culicis TaxID=28005 RepID=S9TFL2_9TRYP|nr:hypothetical protein STCU_11797 [Strigomonas culicis]|eukprot:EPY15739.1 hypothetical protein STCU_11797 [Strigomonas culicis]